MSQLSDLVQDAKLSTKLDSEFTTHTFLESSSVVGRRSRRREREEIWRKKRYLGIGTFGTTWQEECATDGNGQLRAVKEVRKTAIGDKSIDYNRELEATVKFSQQKFDGCFVKSPGWFENEESVFICMEYFPLGNLQQYIVEAFPEGETQHMTLQLLEGLDLMHSNGFAHRDLKPQNIFVLSNNPEWWIKIGDFGLNKRVLQGLTGLQTFNSAPAFTAPESYKATWEIDLDEQSKSSDFDPEVDIWSLGIITHYLLTGRLPFTGKYDLLAYYENESVLPSEILNKCQSSEDALEFLKDILKSSPSDRLTARDALDHTWLAPLLHDSEPEEPVTSPASLTEKTIPPLQPRKPRNSLDIMLPGTINLSSTSTMLGPSTPLTLPSPQGQLGDNAPLTEMFPRGILSQQQQQQPKQSILASKQANDNQIQMQSNMGSSEVADEGYKQMPNNASRPPSALNLISNVHPLHRSAMEPESLVQSQNNESQMHDSSLRPAHLHQASQLSSEMSSSEAGIETLPPYFRRDSDAAPIPISDLDYEMPQAESPVERQASVTESSRGSLERHSSDNRFSDRFRRVSESMMPKRHQQRSQDLGKKSDKNIGVPLSPTSSNSTKASNSKSASRKKTKSQIVEIPGRSQFGEGLPLFPVRVKR
ncbi:hypothetical protein N7478_001011 [Penicillium angulare]|uniref:uncharacterized protein n=1 Tax=Penicillium angulare TaxID=116970 RepID=UPI0025408A1D|nr:uncharacterized protein N7478_001011 [Penicillium angulare]KAJ5291760.1 hypothetical protein N7478_001011 [Penicillium angulare]